MPRWPLAPPSSLDRASKGLWRLTIVQLQAQQTWQDSDLPLLERYVRGLEVARLARGRIAVRELEEEGSGYTAVGSQGQVVQHPDVKTAREAERDANDYAEDLLLTPKSRKQHDIRPKQGSGGRLEAILGGRRPDDGGADRARSA